MRARYYNTDIRRFINQDIITGSIGNSQSLNRYAYVQGNPVSYTDPFGLSPLNAMADAVGHAVLDLIGSIPVFGAPANILNCYWYCKEGNREMAVMSGIAILPGVGQFIGAGAKALKLTRTSQYIITATKFAGSMANCMIAVGTCIETGKRIYHDIRNGKFGLNVNTVANIATIGLSVFAAAVSGKEMAGAGVELANMVAEDLHEFGVKVDTLLSRLRLNDKGFAYLYRAKNNGNGIEGGSDTKHYLHRPYIRKGTIDGVNANTKVNYKTGQIYDSISGKWVDPSNVELGHKQGYEFWRMRDWAEAQGMTQAEFNDFMNNSDFYGWQDISSNRSHAYEQH